MPSTPALHKCVPCRKAGATAVALRHVGFDGEAIVEILAHVALNLFTNDVNFAFAVPVDFPLVKLRRDWSSAAGVYSRCIAWKCSIKPR